MIKNIRYIHARQTNPYANLALEEYLLRTVKPDECILYLWQNEKTVVIGKNQNCWQECKTAELEADGGYVVRRLSGGGAVFHDLGNLNFTFLMHKDNYNVDKQLDVILAAVEKWKIPAKKSGRNDITVDGRKFSGNAFYSSNGQNYHHGTILIDADLENLSRYLNVSAEKMRAKGVSSVKSRVVNLAALHPAISVAKMRQALIASFGAVYGLMPEEILSAAVSANHLAELTRKFSSWDWIFGRPIPFTCAWEKRFDWGDIQLQCNVRGGKILEAAVFSDAMDAAFIAAVAPSLEDCIFSPESMKSAIRKIPLTGEKAKKMSEDIEALLSGGNG